MTDEPKESGLELLDRWQVLADLVSDPERLQVTTDELRRSLEGTFVGAETGASAEFEAPGVTADVALAADLVFDKGTALCLSGSGYRAMLFHAGAVLRLNEAGLLPTLERISSVSGGSIVNGLLALRWADLDFDEQGRASNLDVQVLEPLRRLAGITIDIPNTFRLLTGLVRSEFSDVLIRGYRDHLFGDATLQDLPNQPAFVFVATNMGSGMIWSFRKSYMGDHFVGRASEPRVPLAVAVAASSAYTPLHWPVRLDLSDADLTHLGAGDLRRMSAENIPLADGSLSDPLALETAWKRHGTVLVSDGASTTRFDPNAGRGGIERVIYRTTRMAEVAVAVARSVVLRQLINSYQTALRSGAYWSLRSSIEDYGIPDALPVDHLRTSELGALRGRYARLPADIQERLVAWGYAVADAAIRRHVDPNISRPAGFPKLTRKSAKHPALGRQR